jgi:hypothetical protein
MTNSETTSARATLLHDLESAWNELQTYLTSLTEEQLTRPTDAAGWTAKDHFMHLAVWEGAALAMLEGKSKRERLNITPEVWEQDDDPINAVLQERYHELPAAEVKQTLAQNHARMVQKLEALTDEDFQRPYRHYQPTSTDDRPIIDYIRWDTISHYRDHLSWIKVIVAQA